MLAFFNSHGFTQLEIGIRANEQLGLIDGAAYIEDAHGADGFVTLYRLGSTWETPLMMVEQVPSETVPHTVFAGIIDLTDLVLGAAYGLKGFVTDTHGHVADLSLNVDLEFVMVLALPIIVLNPPLIFFVHTTPDLIVRTVEPSDIALRWLDPLAIVTRFIDPAGLTIRQTPATVSLLTIEATMAMRCSDAVAVLMALPVTAADLMEMQTLSTATRLLQAVDTLLRITTPA